MANFEINTEDDLISETLSTESQIFSTRLALVMAFLTVSTACNDTISNLAEGTSEEMLQATLAGLVFLILNETRKKIEWIRRENRYKLQVSISSIHEEEIWMNKLAEGQIEELLTDGVVAKILRSHCTETTDENALVYIPEKDRERVERVLKTLVLRLLEDPEEVIDIHRGKAEKEEINFWVSFTFERYGLRRNLIPRLILVPEENLTSDKVSQTAFSNISQMPHRYLRVLTHGTMLADINSKGGPKACFKVTVVRKRPKQ